MSTDRELLEDAAKAAGFQIDQRASFMTWRDSRRLALLNPQGGHTLWNADEDDGDALRLAVKLRPFLTAVFEDATQAGGIDDGFDEPHADDPYAATRRAIVRAAAAIGRASA